uniref:Ribonuclease H-like domain-containing protein n=1 Tax=Tanacetum cinerariifolium TaxID=118510 RepID=A0A6L2LBA9_TANCI|nr:ribonuclease H-like domain-containing protein [Tanacetum cinerariifolium]
MWLYKYKYNVDGSLSQYKARLVANGRSQQQGIDCDETFSPVVKPATIRTVLSLVVSRQWPIHQLDVKNAFLYGYLTETVYMHQPPGFTNSAHSDYVCLLQKSLYGLKQPPELGFSDFPAMLFEPISITAKPTRLFPSFKRGQTWLTYYYLGPLNYFLGISATRTTSDIFWSQTKYDTEILERAQMLNWNPCRTPIDTEKKLGPEGSPVTDPTLYHSLAEALQTRCLVLVLRLNTANAVAETSWIRNLLRELHTLLFTTTLVYCDNVSVVYISANPVQHQCTKHIEIDIYFVRDKVAAGHVRVLHVPSRFQYAYIFIKGLPYPLFTDFRSSLSVRKSSALTTGGIKVYIVYLV